MTPVLLFMSMQGQGFEIANQTRFCRLSVGCEGLAKGDNAFFADMHQVLLSASVLLRF